MVAKEIRRAIILINRRKKHNTTARVWHICEMIQVVADSETFRQPLNKTYDAAVRALQKCGFEITERAENIIRASSGISIWSWGEDIQVRLISSAKGTEVKITSEPGAQLFDWGKGIENISRILSELKKQLGK